MAPLIGTPVANGQDRPLPRADQRLRRLSEMSRATTQRQQRQEQQQQEQQQLQQQQQQQNLWRSFKENKERHTEVQPTSELLPPKGKNLFYPGGMPTFAYALPIICLFFFLCS